MFQAVRGTGEIFPQRSPILAYTKETQFRTTGVWMSPISSLCPVGRSHCSERNWLAYGQVPRKYERGGRLGYLQAITDRFSNGRRAIIFHQQWQFITLHWLNQSLRPISSSAHQLQNVACIATCAHSSESDSLHIKSLLIHQIELVADHELV